MKETITWVGSEDDQTAKVGDYVLRAELMDKYWWWCCYMPDYTDEYGQAPTIEEAKAAAIAAMKEHLKKK